MNMPNSSGMPLHKVVADVEAQSIPELHEIMCENDFILVMQRFHNRHQNGETVWEEIGPVILSTFHIAKVQEYIEKDNYEDDNRAPQRVGPRVYRR
jgi:hypothetical protein